MHYREQVLTQLIGATLKDLKREQAVAFRALVDGIKERLDTLERPLVNADGTAIPPAPRVQVTVDLTPVAAALDRFSETLAQQAERADERFTRLLEALADPPAPPVIRVEPAAVPEQSPPAVLLSMPPRPRRRLVLTHEDGTQTTVEEEEIGP